MPDHPLLERRKGKPRFQINIPVTYLEPKTNRVVQTQTYDLSIQGVCLITKKELTPDTRLNMYINMLDNGEKIHIKGKVIWSKTLSPIKYRAGIKLEAPDLNPIPLILRTIKARRNF